MCFKQEKENTEIYDFLIRVIFLETKISLLKYIIHTQNIKNNNNYNKNGRGLKII